MVCKGNTLNIVTELMLILLGLACGFVLAIVQAVLLWRKYKSHSWLVGALFAIALGSKQVYGFIGLPSAILQAQMQGVMIERLSADQWIGVSWSYVIVGLLIAFFDWQRRDLAKIGV